MRVSLITPTRDRPAGFALCERWMSLQTRPADEWIVADDGHTPAKCSAGQVHIRLKPGKDGYRSLAENILAGLEAATGDVVTIIEDDDYYKPWHLMDLCQRLKSCDLAGSVWQPYYNLQHRKWKLFRNQGASLCQTGMSRAVTPLLRKAVEQALTEKSYGIDGRLWRMARKEGVSEDNPENRPTVGIKGLPGMVGLGVGHRPNAQWLHDPSLRVLREWIENDAAFNVYKEIANGKAP